MRVGDWMQRFKQLVGILILALLTFYFVSEYKTSTETKDHIELASFISAKLVDEKYVIDPIKFQPVDADAAVLINGVTGDLLFDQNSDEPLPIASMSKIMTQLIVLEAIEQGHIRWDDVVSISEYAHTISHQPGYASVLLEKDATYTVEQLFHAMSIRSANGATIALAEYVAGSEKAFVVRMNEKAEQLQLSSASFVNSTGLANRDLLGFHSVGTMEDMNVMSARDLAYLSQYVLLYYPELLQITKKGEIQFDDETYTNSNWMLPGLDVPFTEMDLTFPGVDGLKTGFIDECGYCFAGTMQFGDRRVISVVIGTDEIEDRCVVTKQLYETVIKESE